RRGLFSDLGDRARLLKRIQMVGFAVGLPGGVVYAWLGGDVNTCATAVSVVSAPFLSAAYVATLVRLMHATRGAWVRTALAPVGRIALTNYLGQSLAGLLLFTGIGLGLAGRVSPPLLLVLAVAIFILQAAVSACRLKRHRYGPAKYLLRLFTYWTRPRRGQSVSVTTLCHGCPAEAARKLSRSGLVSGRASGNFSTERLSRDHPGRRPAFRQSADRHFHRRSLGQSARGRCERRRCRHRHDRAHRVHELPRPLGPTLPGDL